MRIGLADAWALASGALLVLLALAAAAVIAFESVVRYAAGQSFLGPDGLQWIETYLDLAILLAFAPAIATGPAAIMR